MIGVLLNFLNFLEIDKKDYENKQKEEKTNEKEVSQDFVELKEEDNMYSKESQIIIIAYDEKTNEPIKEEVITESIPISKNIAKRQITRIRIK